MLFLSTRLGRGRNKRESEKVRPKGVEEISCAEEALFAVDQHLSAPSARSDLTGAFVGGSLGDLFVGRMAEVLAIVLNGPAPSMAQDGQDSAFEFISHRLC